MTEGTSVEQEDLGIKPHRVKSEVLKKEKEAGELTAGAVIGKFLEANFSEEERDEVELLEKERRIFSTLEDALGDYAPGYISCDKLAVSDEKGNWTRVLMEMKDYLGGTDDLYQAMLRRVRLAANTKGNNLPPDFKIGIFKDPKEKATYYCLHAFEYQIPDTANERVFFVLSDANILQAGIGPALVARSIVYFDGENYHQIYDSDQNDRLVRYRLYESEGERRGEPRDEWDCLDRALGRENETWLGEVTNSGMLSWFHEEGHHQEEERFRAFAWIGLHCGHGWIDAIDPTGKRGRYTQDQFRGLPINGKLAFMVNKAAVRRSERKAWINGLQEAQIQFADSKIALNQEELKAFIIEWALVSYERAYAGVPSRLSFTENTGPAVFKNACWEILTDIQELLEQESTYSELSHAPQSELRAAILSSILAVADEYQEDTNPLESIREKVRQKGQRNLWSQEAVKGWLKATDILKADYNEDDSGLKMADWGAENWRKRLEGLRESKDLAEMVVLGYLGMYAEDIK